MVGKSQSSENQSADMRRAMVSRQLRDRDIRDRRVLEIMAALPRELFIPKPWRSSAYDDRAVPIGLDQTISQPYMVAIMSEKLNVEPHHRVLEIGTGSGYQTAILAALADHVYTIERLAELSHRARETLTELGIDNVTFKIDDGTLGWPEHAPYERIIVTAAAPHLPRELVNQLTNDGTAIIPVGPADYQDLLRIRNSEGRRREESILACRFVKLLGRNGWPEK